MALATRVADARRPCAYARRRDRRRRLTRTPRRRFWGAPFPRASTDRRRFAFRCPSGPASERGRTARRLPPPRARGHHRGAGESCDHVSARAHRRWGRPPSAARRVGAGRHMPFALHAAYWHDRFGEPKSGGCVNLSVRDAKWLFSWTEPQVPATWHSVRSGDDRGPGTWGQGAVKVDSGCEFSLHRRGLWLAVSAGGGRKRPPPTAECPKDEAGPALSRRAICVWAPAQRLGRARPAGRGRTSASHSRWQCVSGVSPPTSSRASSPRCRRLAGISSGTSACSP